MILWVGGVLHVSLESAYWREAFTQSIVDLLDQRSGFAGVHLNMEPMPSGNEDFLRLLEEIKAALLCYWGYPRMMTKVLAVEWARHNIQVNAIAPTYMKTAILNPDPEIQKEMVQHIPLGRLGKADDLKGTIVYLASGASDFMTGHTLMVDGGYTAW